MIPKILHYCWVGPNGPSELNIRCRSSWEEHLPGFEIRCWSEKNSPMDHPYVKHAYAERRYGYLIDYIRLYALYNHGGIFIDYDFLILKNLDFLLGHEFFSGMINEREVGMGIVGCEKGHPAIGKLLDFYDSLGQFKDAPSTHIATNIFKEMGWDTRFNKIEGDIAFYPSEYFYAYPLGAAYNGQSYQEHLTGKSVAVHLWENTWIKPEFRHFWFGDNRKGLITALGRIVRGPFLGRQYYKDLGYHILRLIGLR